MTDQERDIFAKRLVSLCQRSEELGWEEMLKEVLATLGDFCQTNQIVFIPVESARLPRRCFFLGEDSPSLCEALRDYIAQMDASELHYVDLLATGTSAWILPVPVRTDSEKIGHIALFNLTGESTCTAEQQNVLADNNALFASLLQSICLRGQLATQAITLNPIPHSDELIATMNQIIVDLNRATGIKQILEIGLHHAIRTARAIEGEIYLWDPETRKLRQHIQSVADPATQKSAKNVSRTNLPLIENEQAVGVMNLTLPEGQEITPETRRLLNAILEHTMLAMQRDRLSYQMSERLQTMHYLYEISAAFLSQGGTSSVLFILLRAIADLLNGSLGVAFYSRQNGEWRRERVYMTPDALSLRKQWATGKIWEREEDFLTTCEQERMLVIAGQKWGREPVFQASLDTLGAKQVLYLPLALPSDEVFGIIGVLLPVEELINAHKSALLWAVVQQGAAALLRVRLYDESELSKSRLQAILDSSRDGILLVGNDLDIHYVNEQWLRMLAMPPRPHTWQGQPLASMLVVLESEAPKAALWIEQVMQDGESPEHIAPPLFETAHNKLLEAQHRAVYSEKRQRLGALYIFRDVTEQKNLEQMRDDLFHMLVHDMRNPLAVIISAFQILQDPDMRSLSEEVIEIATDNANRLLRLVNAMLDIGKLESGRFKLDWQPIALADQLEAIVQDFSFTQKEFSLEISLPDDLPILWGDPAIVRRVFENLLSNALKFIPDEGGVIRIIVQQETEGWVRIEIYNNGPHIAEEIYNRLFTKFVTGEYSQRGYGLGLAFCRLAIENHGGHIWAENREGGVSFYFTLPTKAPTD